MTAGQRWQLAGSAPEVYAEHLVPAIFAGWAPVMLDAAGVAAGHAVLDVACGTGVVADAAAARVGADGSVTGVDSNPAMIAVATARSAGGIRWHQADAQSLPFPDATFDRVLCQAGLQYVPAKLTAVREMHRVLRPAGQVAVLVWRGIDHCPAFAALADALDAEVGEEAAAVMWAPFACGDDPRPLASLLRHAGFTDVVVETRSGTVRFGSAETLVRYQCAGSPLAAHVDIRDDALLSRLARRIAARLDVTTDGSIAAPIEAHLACGTAAAR